MRTSIIALIAALALSACGDGELDPEVVTSIPPGNGVGAAASGGYRLEVQTLSCSGTCPTINLGFLSWRLCESGHRATEHVQVLQKDGVLEVNETGSSMYVENLRGGINKDGTFDVGGYEIQEGTSVGVAVRAAGTIAGNSFTATAKARGNGEYNGQTIACSAAYQVTGHRQ